ncbi:MAG: DUF393 domain-containing protein [Verrucomicrobia bacterium]|nr:DUF393 domain-containing protein [Verrucomicrobiota bacterium]
MEIVFFDGVCGLCNHFVNFLLRYDKKRKLVFSPLQGKTIQKTKAAPLANEQTIVFLKGDLLFVKSKAAIETIAALGGVFKLTKILLIIPRFIRDFVYSQIAKRRYRWFGKIDGCRVPKFEEKPYFLE